MNGKKGGDPEYRLLRENARIRAGHYHAGSNSIRFHFSALIITCGLFVSSTNKNL